MQHRVLEEDNDTTIEDVHVTAGKVIRIDRILHDVAKAVWER